MNRLTIGITFFNRLQDLKLNVKNLLKEVNDYVDIVIVNDNIKINLKYSDIDINICDQKYIKIINNEENMGEYLNFHALIRECKSGYFTWLADDDVYEEGLLSLILTKLNKNYDIIITNYKLKFQDNTTGNFYPKKNPHEFILSKKIKSVSLYCIYKKDFLSDLIKNIPTFCSAKIALYFEYALLLNLYELNYNYLLIYEKKIIINNSKSSWSASNADIEYWRDGFVNLLKYAASTKLDFRGYISLFKIMINDQISILIRANYSIIRGYLSLLKFLLFNGYYINKNKYFIIYIYYSILYSIKLPILMYKRKYE